MVGTAVLLGAVIVLLALAGALGNFALALVFMAMASALFTVFQVSTSVVLTLLVPEEFRGRVMGLRSIIWSLSPLGGLLGALVATWVSTPFAFALGGVVVIVITLSMYALSSELRHVRALVEEVDARHSTQDAQERAAPA